MTNACDVTVSVLGFHEDGEWCVLARTHLRMVRSRWT